MGKQWREVGMFVVILWCQPLLRAGRSLCCKVSPMGCHEVSHQVSHVGLAERFQMMPAGCWKEGLPSGWVSPGSHSVTQGSPAQLCPAGLCCHGQALPGLAPKPLSLGSFCVSAYQLQLMAPALWTSEGVWHTRECRRRGQSGGVELNSPNWGHRWGPVKARWAFSCPHPKPLGTPPVPEAVGRDWALQSKGIFIHLTV